MSDHNPAYLELLDTRNMGFEQACYFDVAHAICDVSVIQSHQALIKRIRWKFRLCMETPSNATLPLPSPSHQRRPRKYASPKKPSCLLPLSFVPFISSPLILLQILRTRIAYPVLIDREQTVTLRQTRTVVDFTNPRLPSPLLQTQPRCACVGNDVASDGLLRVWIEHGARTAVDLRDDLIGDDDSDTELVREAL